MLPFLEVSRLAPASSFYSAILQPLGLHYIAPDSDGQARIEGSPYSSPSTITFGTYHYSPPLPLFQIREVRDSLEPLRHSRLVLSAPSPSAVADFRAFASRANPSQAIGNSLGQNLHQSPGATTDCGETRATVTDLDGNTLEVVSGASTMDQMVYVPPSSYHPRHNGSTVRRTQSTHGEVSRILDWNYDVASSNPQSSAGSQTGRSALAMTRRPGRFPDDEPYTVLRRSVTTSTLEPSPRQSPNGVTTSTVVGTLLGVAAGAALTYGMMKHERMRAPRQEYDVPGFQRRATFPDPYPSDMRGRFVEVERTVEKVRYPDDYAPVPDHRSPPQYMARYSQVGAPKSREYDDIYDDRSRHSSRQKVGRSSSVRTRSEAAATRVPLMITEGEPRSQVGSRHAMAPMPTHHSVLDGDRDSYVSARSRRSSSTIRPPPLPAAQSELAMRSRVSTRVPGTTIKVPGHPTFSVPPNASRSGSYYSPRNVPLPMSGVGSSHADWDDDAGSVAPSDSISCVGSGTRSRRYH